MIERFRSLFDGFDEAFGTGKGSWVERPPETQDFEEHLAGKGVGIGIGPLRRDGTVKFAAIDLDEPDFEAAVEMQKYIPGPSFIEKSRSGNAHVWVFFSDPIEAWVPRGILKEAVLAAGKAGVEIFPKQDAWHDHIKFGSYINLPYHGHDRPILEECWDEDPRESVGLHPIPVKMFVEAAHENLNDPEDWRKRAQWLMIEPPGDRRGKAEFGKQPELHMCAEHIIAMRDENPIIEGHRAAVYFALAKMLANYEGFDDEECLYMMRLVNYSSPDPIPNSELSRIYNNAKRGQFTSTDCDNPLVAPFTHPDCPIAHGR